MEPDLEEGSELGRLLEAALDLPPDQWRSFLEQRASRLELARQAEEMLRREAELSGFLADSPVASPLPSDALLGATHRASLSNVEVPSSSDLLEESRQIGPYRIVEELGSGGMGVVYLAEQEQPVRRQVALKVIKQGMDTRQVVARFEAERQALALMDHPAIARVYSAGATPQGRPYFAMELVRGEPITKHCDRQRMTVRQRLKLFAETCDAVQHAHHKAVIHRDLKPSNVLVSVSDDPDSLRRAMPKIIDFGIAKATAERLTEETYHTHLGALVGTPAYMSPEQAAGRTEDIDTRADVYALGAILYELLVGIPPVDPAALREGGLEAMVQRIREAETPRLSLRFSTLGEEASTEAAALRGGEPRTLRRELNGDLEWITLKALAKERERRYSSPRELVADIERYLADEPILARPPSIAYQARKLLHRHRTAATAAALIFLLLLGYAISMGVQFRRIAAQRDRANAEARRAENEAARAAKEAEAKGQVSEFLQSLFSVSDPEQSLGETITARELLDRGAERIDEELEDQPELQAEMMQTIGAVYRELGLYPQAEIFLTRAWTKRQELLGQEHPGTLDSALELADLFSAQARYDEAERLGRESLEVSRQVLGERHPLTVTGLIVLANIVTPLGKLNEAENLERRAIEIRRRKLGEDHPDVLYLMLNLAHTITLQGRFVEAEKIERRILDIQRRTVGDDHPDTLLALNNLGNSLFLLGRFREAEGLLREAADRTARVFGKDHPESLASLNNLAETLGKLRRHVDAEKLHRQVLAARIRVLGEDHPDSVTSLLGLGATLRAQGRHAEAESLHRQAFALGRETFREQEDAMRYARLELVKTLLVVGRHQEAESAIREGLEVRKRLFGIEHPEYFEFQRLLGDLLLRKGQPDEARELLELCLQAQRRALGEPNSADLFYSLASLEANTGDPSGALEYLSEAVRLGFSEARIVTDPWLDPLRGKPEMETLVAEAVKGR